VETLGSAVRDARAFGCIVLGLVNVGIIDERDRRQAHDAAVAGLVWIGRAGVGIARLREPAERAGDRHADVEADAVAAEIAFLPPAHVAFHLVAGVETAALFQAIAE